MAKPAEEPIAPTTETAPLAKARTGLLGDLVGYRMRRAMSAMNADFAEAMEGTGIRPVLFAILAMIGQNPGINQTTLGRALGVQRANMVPLVTQLVDRTLVARRPAANDRRASALSLTPAGEALLSDCVGRVRAHEARMLAGLGAAERGALIDLLARIGEAP